MWIGRASVVLLLISGRNRGGVTPIRGPAGPVGGDGEDEAEDAVEAEEGWRGGGTGRAGTACVVSVSYSDELGYSDVLSPAVVPPRRGERSASSSCDRAVLDVVRCDSEAGGCCCGGGGVAESDSGDVCT